MGQDNVMMAIPTGIMYPVKSRDFSPNKPHKGKMTSYPSLTFQSHLVGGGRLEELEGSAYRLLLPPIAGGYANAQIDDYQGLSRSDFPHHPPIRIRLRARSSPAPNGTLGFGLWNDPFGLSLGLAGATQKIPATPQALWFFYGSSPNDLTFISSLPGAGWRAASIRSPSIPGALFTPAAAAAYLVCRIPWFRKVLIPQMKSLVKAHEAVMYSSPAEWHDYRIEWEVDRARFYLDGERILDAPSPPTGPLGFVAWVDNQYAVVSAQKGIHFGTLRTDEPQWLSLSDIQLES